ncbi:MAG: PaaI family thioesterase [Actinobacteria bacterium]|nr:PaaI family thioesterase [Actinomycetota bacterium]
MSIDDPTQRLAGDTRLEVAEACRSVIDELASSTADSQKFAAARDLLRQAVEVLASESHGRPYEGAEASLAAYQEHLFIDHSPLVGPLNPLAPPIDMSARGTTVTGVVTFGDAYEGPPGCVHGGFIAASFDEILGFSQGLTGKPGMTARLVINYRSPTPLHQPLRFTGDIDRVEGRKIFVHGELRVVADGRLCAEAEGLFLSMNPEVFDRLMRNRADQT